MKTHSLDTVRKFFDRCALDPEIRKDQMVLSGYGRPSPNCRPWWTPEVEARLFADIQTKLFAGANPQSLSVLEIGCAGGNILQQLAGRTRNLVGVDLSLPMLRIAQGLNLPKVAYLQANGLSLPFRDSTFDRVLAYFVVINFPDDEHVLALVREAARVLSPGGRIFVGNIPDRRKQSELREFLAARTANEVRRTPLPRRCWNRVRRFFAPSFPPIQYFACSPELFADFAASHGLQIEIQAIDVPGFIYAPYRFDVQLSKP